MRTCIKCLENKDISVFHRKSSAKDGYASVCKFCDNKRKLEWQKNNPEKVAERSKRYREKNKEKIVIANKLYFEKNREYINKRSLLWIKNNPAKANAITMRRLAQKKNATPKWADLQKIQIEYELASWCTNVTGIKYEVDHIVPLQSKLVCGLHCEANLRVITKKANQEKSNKYWENMP